MTKKIETRWGVLLGGVSVLLALYSIYSSHSTEAILMNVDDRVNDNSRESKEYNDRTIDSFIRQDQKIDDLDYTVSQSHRNSLVVFKEMHANLLEISAELKKEKPSLTHVSNYVNNISNSIEYHYHFERTGGLTREVNNPKTSPLTEVADTEVYDAKTNIGNQIGMINSQSDTDHHAGTDYHAPPHDNNSYIRTVPPVPSNLKVIRIP